MQLMFTAVLFAFTSGLALLLTALQIRLNARLQLTAAPRSDRWHRNPTPSSGGIAIFGAAATAYCIWFRGAHLPIALGVASLWLLGLLDDRIRLRPALKLLGQCLVAGAVVLSGVVFHGTSVALVNVVVSFVWLVGATNAFNLIDNMDGLCAGVTVIIAGSRFFLLATAGNWSDANLCALIGAAYAGFLILNYSPARIFMGDCGSMLAGFSLAALAIDTPLAHTKVFMAGIFYPALTFIYPVFDTLLVSVLRKFAGRPISVGGRDHSSHRLVSLGLSDSRVVWILWALTAAGCAIGLMVRAMPLGLLAIGGLLCVGLAVFGIFLASLPAFPLAAPASGSSWLRRHLPSLRAGIILQHDILLAGIALICAFLVRFGPHVPPDQLRNLTVSFPIIVLLHAAVSYHERTWELSWTSFRVRDVVPLARVTVIAASLAFVTCWMLGLRSYSRGVIVLYCVFAVAFGTQMRCSLPVLRTIFCIRSGASILWITDTAAEAAVEPRHFTVAAHDDTARSRLA